MVAPALNTPQRVIWDAYFNAAKIGVGSDPSSEQYAIGMNRLNNLVNIRQTEGLRLWLQQDLSVTLVAGQNLYTFGPAAGIIMTRPTRIIEAYYQYPATSNQTNVPLNMISRNEWDSLGTFTSQGMVNSVFVDKQIPQLNVWLWLNPDAITALGTVHLIIQQQQPNVTGLVDTMVLGPEWFLYLSWELALELSQGQPVAVQEKCEKHAMRWKEVVDNFDYEDTGTRFAPDPQMLSGTGRFT